MKSKVEINDHMLTIAAKICYPFERAFYQNDLWNKARNIVDVGCGNAEYISMVAKDYPNKKITAIENDSTLSAIAYERHNKNNLTILDASYENLPNNSTFDFITGRRVIKYLKDRHNFYSWILENSAPTAGILIVDTAMENFYVDSSFNITSEFYKFLPNNKKLGSTISNEKLVESELMVLGFSNVSTQSIIINTSVPGVKENTYIYMHLAAEYALGSPLPSNIEEELFNWLINSNSYAEFEIFGALFERK